MLRPDGWTLRLSVIYGGPFSNSRNPTHYFRFFANHSAIMRGEKPFAAITFDFNFCVAGRLGVLVAGWLARSPAWWPGGGEAG